MYFVYFCIIIFVLSFLYYSFLYYHFCIIIFVLSFLYIIKLPHVFFPILNQYNNGRYVDIKYHFFLIEKNHSSMLCILVYSCVPVCVRACLCARLLVCVCVCVCACVRERGCACVCSLFQPRDLGYLFWDISEKKNIKEK